MTEATLSGKPLTASHATKLAADPRFGRVENLPVLTESEFSDKFHSVVFAMYGHRVG